MRRHVVAAGTVLMLLTGMTSCGEQDESAAPPLTTPPVTTPPSTAAPGDAVPSWAGDYSMPPPVLVLGMQTVELQPWTWGWTFPPNANGEQESLVADGVPPDPLETIEHDGFVGLEYALPGWTFTAFVHDDESRPLEVVAAGDTTFRIELPDVPDHSEIWVVGRAEPGSYELFVSFAVTRREVGASTMSADPAMIRAGDSFEVNYDGSLDEMRGGFFVLADSDGVPVAMLWSDKFEGEGPGFNLDVANAPVLDFGVVTPGPDTLVLPPDLDAGTYELCTENSRPIACTTIEVTR